MTPVSWSASYLLREPLGISMTATISMGRSYGGGFRPGEHPVATTPRRLDPLWIGDATTVGLTAGGSAPPTPGGGGGGGPRGGGPPGGGGGGGGPPRGGARAPAGGG